MDFNYTDILWAYDRIFFLINKIYQKVQTINGVEMIEKMPFNTMLSACIVLVSLITVLLSVIAPARKISKINIIDGIKGNFNIKKILNVGNMIIYGKNYRLIIQRQ